MISKLTEVLYFVPEVERADHESFFQQFLSDNAHDMIIIASTKRSVWMCNNCAFLLPFAQV